jgi:predicted DsbA family dithiol-disulfide isomerase
LWGVPKLQVDIWSDIACPWCHVGKRRLEAALARFPHRDQVEVIWRAFELDPDCPRERDPAVPYAERLGQKYGRSTAQGEQMIAQMTQIAKEDGLDFHFELIRPGNTFDAHRLLHLAHDRGVQDAVKERLLRGYLSEGAPIGDPETLVRLATEAGVDADEARAVLAGDAYTAAVRDEEQEAAELGISGVPFFVIGGKYGISGAQRSDLLLSALQQAWAEQELAPLEEGLACGPDGCGPADPAVKDRA